MAGNTFVTQAALQISAQTAASTRVTQVAITGQFKTHFKTCVTQTALTASVWTAFRTQASRVALVAWVITCASTSYVPPPATGDIVLAATPGAVDTGTINLSWTGLTGFTYTLYRGTAPADASSGTPTGGDWTPVASGMPQSSYQDTGLAYHTTYYYMVVAENACSDATTSNVSSAVPGCTLPNAPQELAASAGPAPHQVVLRGRPVANCTYDVFRGKAPGAEGAEALAAGLATPLFVDEDAPVGGMVYYTVAAVNACGLSDPSTEVSVFVDCCTLWTGGIAPATSWTANGC
jgi:hypothetical protein